MSKKIYKNRIVAVVLAIAMIVTSVAIAPQTAQAAAAPSYVITEANGSISGTYNGHSYSVTLSDAQANVTIDGNHVNFIDTKSFETFVDAEDGIGHFFFASGPHIAMDMTNGAFIILYYTSRKFSTEDSAYHLTWCTDDWGKMNGNNHTMVKGSSVLTGYKSAIIDKKYFYQTSSSLKSRFITREEFYRVLENGTSEGTDPVPTQEPTAEPTVKPTTQPTVKPTTQPTVKPTTQPTVKPTTQPTVKPTTEPTVKPTTQPTVKPTTEPTVKPTAEPTTKPSDNGGANGNGGNANAENSNANGGNAQEATVDNNSENNNTGDNNTIINNNITNNNQNINITNNDIDVNVNGDGNNVSVNTDSNTGTGTSTGIDGTKKPEEEAQQQITDEESLSVDTTTLVMYPLETQEIIYYARNNAGEEVEAQVINVSKKLKVTVTSLNTIKIKVKKTAKNAKKYKFVVKNGTKKKKVTVVVTKVRSVTSGPRIKLFKGENELICWVTLEKGKLNINGQRNWDDKTFTKAGYIHGSTNVGVSDKKGNIYSVNRKTGQIKLIAKSIARIRRTNFEMWKSGVVKNNKKVIDFSWK